MADPKGYRCVSRSRLAQHTTIVLPLNFFPNAFLLAHLPGAAEMTSAGVLSMYWGLALGFGLFALLLVIFTRGRLGKQDGPG